MVSMLKNRIFRFNCWLDNNEITKFFLLLSSVLLFSLPLHETRFSGWKFELISKLRDDKLKELGI